MGYKMKGHDLPGPNQKKEKVDPDAPGTPGTPGYEPPVHVTDYLTKDKTYGPWEKETGKSPMKETTSQTLQGMDFKPYAHKALNVDDIPSFRDMVSLEQQQAARKAWKDKRFEKKKPDYEKRMEEERPERERQELAAQGELYSEEAAMEQREKNKRKQEAERRANEPIDYDALELPEEEFPEENA